MIIILKTLYLKIVGTKKRSFFFSFEPAKKKNPAECDKYLHVMFLFVFLFQPRKNHRSDLVFFMFLNVFKSQS